MILVCLLMNRGCDKFTKINGFTHHTHMQFLGHDEKGCQIDVDSVDLGPILRNKKL